MIACGASCGISVAFGAPIGGALFSYEISKPNTFWTFSMLWRVFTATSVATFTLSLFECLYYNRPLSVVDSGFVKFTTFNSAVQNSMLDLPAAIVLGLITGLLGALLVKVSTSLQVFRKKYVSSKVTKVFECLLFAFLTSSAFYLVVAFRSDCR